MMTRSPLTVTFKAGTTHSEVNAIFAKVSGISDVTQVFPDVTALAHIYVVAVDSKEALNIVKKLKAEAGVENAYVPSKRSIC